MKFPGYTAALFAIVTIASVHSEDTKYDLTDKHQFSFYFREQWQTMFNTPQPVANPAKAIIVSLLDDKKFFFQPCYTVERTSTAHRYFVDRLWGMMNALKHCTVTESKVLPPDPNNNKDTAVLEMEFVQKATYTSYNRHFHDIRMEMRARKAEVNQPFRIYHIVEVCHDL